VSDVDPVRILLSKLHSNGDTIAEAYYQNRIHKTESNARSIEALRQLRIMSPDIRDAFQLRSSFRQFLITTLNTGRLYSLGADIGGYFSRLARLVDEHSIAFQEGRDDDCLRYEDDTREAISDIADAIEDELIVLAVQVNTRFGAVSTVAEKIRQNRYYYERTNKLVTLLESFHFSDIDEQLSGHEDLALSFRSLLADRIPAFRESLLSVLQTLDQYLFEYREIKERTRRVRAFALHLARNPDWEPRAWDDVTQPALWLQCAKPLALACHPRIDDPEAEDFLAEVARTIPASANTRTRSSRPPGRIEQTPGNTVIAPPESPIRKAVRLYFRAARNFPEGISARKWWAENPSIIGDTKEHMWLLRVLAEHDNKGKAGMWNLRLDFRRHPDFDGNILIRDVIVSRRAA
jgi:hypothetical protein